MTYSPAFNTAVTHLLSLEGGYVDNPNDRGGKTNFGISQRAYPALDIAALTKADAVEIYHQDYWRACHCEELPYPLSAAVLDSAVNHGQTNGIKMLQRAIHVTPDGKFGPVTSKAVSRYTPEKILIDLLAIRARYYCAIVLKRPNQIGFLVGWCKRLFRLQNHLLTTKAPQ